jgi:hypothetical protein
LLTGSLLTGLRSLNFPPPSVIAAHGGGARGFCSMGSGPLIGTARDALEYEFEARSTEAGVLLTAHFGRTEVRRRVAGARMRTLLDDLLHESAPVSCCRLHVSLTLLRAAA